MVVAQLVSVVQFVLLFLSVVIMFVHRMDVLAQVAQKSVRAFTVVTHVCECFVD